MKEVFVRLINGRTRKFVAQNVERLKEQIYDVSGVSADQQRLWDEGKQATSLIDGAFLNLTVPIRGGMPKSKSKKKKKKDEPPPPEPTEFDTMNMEEVILARKALRAELREAKRARNYAELDIEQLTAVYDITRDENARLHIYNKKVEAKMETMKNNFHNQCQMFRQKVKETDYNHENTLHAVGLGFNASLQSQAAEHDQRVVSMLASKAAIEEALEKERLANEDDIMKVRDTNSKELVQLRERFQRYYEKLESKFTSITDRSMQELDLRGRMELMKIEEMKNMHLRDLCQNHEHAFEEMRTYYQSITRDNLQMITALKEELAELSTRIKQHETKYIEICAENKKLREPLAKASKEHERLTKVVINQPKTKRSLKLAQNRLQVLNEKFSSLKDSKVKLGKELVLAETNNGQLRHDLETTVQQMHARSNKSLSHLHEHVQETHMELEKMISQFQDIVNTQKVEPVLISEIETRVHEVLDMKNKQIEDVKYEIVKLTKQHDDMVRVFESKLRDMGVPEEELGLKTINDTGNTVPARLVAT